MTAAEAAAHVAAAEAATHVAAAAATTMTTATTAAAAGESAGRRKRQGCCENCNQGKFFAHDIYPLFKGVALCAI
jgi:hypothetical protein